MDEAFWLAKWRNQEIGFHQSEIHPMLLAHWPAEEVPAGARVLVPLCGKSLDMRWLAAQGLDVVGFELSERAVRDFFAEQELTPTQATRAGFQIFQAAKYTLYCGDFMQADTALCPPCTAYFDRAALIALAPSQRATYLQAVQRLLTPQARGLLITVEYQEGLVSPPPFSVLAEEVHARYDEWSEVRLIERRASDVKGRAADECAYALALRVS